MTPKAKRIARIVFWTLFLAGSVVAARVLWLRAEPLLNHPVIAPWWWQRQVDALASSDRATALRAWAELENGYLRKWAAYDWVIWRVKENIWKKDDPPIHFRLERSGHRYHATTGAPGGDCRTVTDALMAMLHQDTHWRTPYAGDWGKWWDANWTRYRNYHFQAKPSGPEDPHAGRRK